MPDWEQVKAQHADRQLEYLRRFTPGFTEDKILGPLVKSPADYERLNRHMVHGAFHGGDRGLAFSGAAPPGARLGVAPDADPRAVPDRRIDPSGRIDHRRARPERRDRAAARPRARPGGGDGRAAGRGDSAAVGTS